MGISIQDDLRLEGTETLTFTFAVEGANGGVVIDLPTLEITIQDNDGRPEF